MATIQGIYVALFGRPADPLGLAYFNEATGNGADLTAIGDLAATAEYQDRFDGMNNAQIVTAIYQSLFGRSPELAGLEFFVNALNNGDLNINNVAIAILDGAQGADADIVANKVAAADLFTAAIAADADALAAYQGDKGIDAGVRFLAPITADDATVPTEAQVDAAVAAIAGGTGTPGVTLTLTTGVDTINGTASDDTIRAVDLDAAGNATGETLQSFDIIDGGAGLDTLNISADAYAASAAPVIRNVEIINNASGRILDLGAVTGAEQIWATGAGGSYTNANIATIFGARVTSAVNVDYSGALAGTNDVANVAVTGGATLTVTSGNAAAIEGLNVAAVGNGAVTANGLTALKTVEVAGTGNITVTANATTITSFDASDATGRVSFTSGNLAADATVVGGAGNDVLNFANVAGATIKLNIDGGAGNDQITGGAGNDTINGGAGNDLITGGLGGDNLTGGEGNDVFIYTAAAQSQNSATPANTLDTITDFNTGNDTIDFSGIAAITAMASAASLTALQNAVDNLVDTTPAATLAQALALLAPLAAHETVAGQVSYFQFKGDTYVVADAAVDGYTDAADMLIKLTGSVELSAADFAF